MTQLYFAGDLAVALLLPLAVLWAVRTGRLQPVYQRLFWIGVGIGFCWELPIFALSAWSSTPMLSWPAGLPLSPVVFMVAHSLWDGGLLLAGLLLATCITGRGPMSPMGATLQLVWGQITELLVELSAITAGAWVYLDGVRFNPPLFTYLGAPLPAALHGIWFVASLVFAAIAARTLALRPA